MSVELNHNNNTTTTSHREEEKKQQFHGNGNSNIDTNDNKMKLSPEVITRLHQLQDANRPVSIDEILKAANLSHLGVNQPQPKPSKSADNRLLSTPLEQDDIVPTKSASMTLAERRRIPASTEKLRLYAQIAQSSTLVSPSSSSPKSIQQEENNNNNDSLLERYESENDELPPEDADLDLLAHLERQQNILVADPKSTCIDSSGLSSQINTILNSNNNDEQKEDEFWKCISEDYNTVVPRIARLLIGRLRLYGIATPWRSIVWQAMAQSSDTHLASMYDKLIQGDMGISSYERVIDRDVTRMIDHHYREAMARLLKAYSVYDAHVGYCQGLAMLARPLLMVMPEQQAFCTFVRLMETHEMRTLFMLNMEGLHLRLHQFQTLLLQQCPLLFQHLSEHSIHAPMYASQWFLTLFASSLPTAVILRMYDLVFSQGAIPTMMRVAIAVMQKHQERLLNIGQFEQLMMYLTSGTLFDDANELVMTVLDTLTSTITITKLDSIAETYQKENEQAKDRAQQLLNVRLNNKTNRRNKRESWFSWGSSSSLLNNSNEATATSKGMTVSPPTSPLSPAPSNKSSLDNYRNVSTLHQQIEDLVTALSQLQKEHSQLNENVTSMKMHQIDYETERNKLTKRNTTLEKRLKKYKAKLANATGAPPSTNSLPPSAAATPNNRIEKLEKDNEFKSFVDSLRMSGDFGSLIAGALATDGSSDSDNNIKTTTNRKTREVNKKNSSTTSTRSSLTASTSSYRHSNSSSQHDDSENDTVATAIEDLSPTNHKDNSKERGEALHHVTSELVAIKLANFEMGQKYEQMCHKYQQLDKQWNASQHEQTELKQQVNALQTTIEALQLEKEQILQEHEDISRENEELMEKNMAAKRTSAELQFEKMSMSKEMEKLEKQVQTLEKEKQEYFMPRGTFSEEVFAAHRILFETTKKEQEHHNQGLSRRHTLQIQTTKNNEEGFQSKYVESDLRCRELEKLLAEAKVKLAEYEASTMPLSPRASLQRSSIHMKRTSTASLSMLASRVTSPTSITDPSRRDSAESYASSVTSATSLGSAPNNNSSNTNSHNKRSSMYAHLWNSGGSATTSVATVAANNIRNSVVVKQQI
ncbi:rab-GTPase-TBC domain-containing protein [Circinella umbellata]|nr:rab-GTPase-TBC domain-containing protein [Circinella umbellata]